MKLNDNIEELDDYRKGLISQLREAIDNNLFDKFISETKTKKFKLGGLISLTQKKIICSMIQSLKNHPENISLLKNDMLEKFLKYSQTNDRK